MYLAWPHLIWGKEGKFWGLGFTGPHLYPALLLREEQQTGDGGAVKCQIDTNTESRERV